MQKVSSPNDQNEQSFEVLPDDHIRATEESKIIRHSCRDRCAQCWRQCKSAHTTDQPPTATLMRWIVRRAAWLIPRFRRSDVQVPVLSCHGRTVSRKTGGVWRNSSCTPSRGRKGIWKSRTEVGRQMEIWLVGGKERPHRPSTLSERTMELEKQLVRREPQVSHRDPTETEVDDNR